MKVQDKKVSYHFGQFTPEHWEKLRYGLELFNEKKFWECHEYLEDHWLEDVSDQARLVYWAVIQVANAMFHWRESNLNGAVGQLKKALEKLKRAENMHVETDFLFDCFNWHDFKKSVRAVEREGFSHESLEVLANFKFISKD